MFRLHLESPARQLTVPSCCRTNRISLNHRSADRVMRVNFAQLGKNQRSILSPELAQADEGQGFKAKQIKMLRCIYLTPIAGSDIQQVPVRWNMRQTRGYIQRQACSALRVAIALMPEI